MGLTRSPDPISRIMRKMDTHDEKSVRAVDIEGRAVEQHLQRYFDASRKSTAIYGNRTVYSLFPLYNTFESAEEVQAKYTDFLSHLSKLINGQIEEEVYEDECRKLLGTKAYQLFTIHKVIRCVYNQICEFDSDKKLHEFYKLFLAMQQKPRDATHRKRYFVLASQLALRKPVEELYLVEYFEQHTMCVSLVNKYVPSLASSVAAVPAMMMPMGQALAAVEADKKETNGAVSSM